jgi:hypothetical protein
MAAAPDDDARRTLAELEAKLRELERELLRGRDPEPPPAPPAPEPSPTAAAPAPPEPEPSPTPSDAEAFPEAPGPDPFAAAEPAPPDTAAFPEAPEPTPPDSLGAEADPPDLAAKPAAPDAQAFPEHDPFAAAEPVPPDSLGADLAFPPRPLDDAEPPPPELDLEALADVQELLAGLRATIEELEATAGRITVEARTVVEDHGRALARLDLAARAAARAEEAAAEAGRVAGTVVIEAGPFAEPGPLLALRDALAAQPGTKDAYVRGVEDGRAVIEVHLAPSAPAQGTEPPGGEAPWE